MAGSSRRPIGTAAIARTFVKCLRRVGLHPSDEFARDRCFRAGVRQDGLIAAVLLQLLPLVGLLLEALCVRPICSDASGDPLILLLISARTSASVGASAMACMGFGSGAAMNTDKPLADRNKSKRYKGKARPACGTTAGRSRHTRIRDAGHELRAQQPPPHPLPLSQYSEHTAQIKRRLGSTSHLYPQLRTHRPFRLMSAVSCVPSIPLSIVETSANRMQSPAQLPRACSGDDTNRQAKIHVKHITSEVSASF